ncbi:hypothetical protein ACFL2Y_01630 [Candidatus Omnitrophota bacterium]
MKIKNSHSILALGADIKSKFCVVKNNNLTLSKDFGNLGELDNFKQYKKSVLKDNSSFDTIVFDLHPGYFSSGLADSLKSRKKLAIQHHHAHIAAVLSSREISRPVIGVSFDGTGYGADGNMWGGEFMVVDGARYRRLAHFEYLAMPGAELVVREPWRMAFSLIQHYLGDKVFGQDLELLRLFPRKYYDVLIRMIKNNINSPLTSSVGRLFDAASSILEICHKIDYEAEAAIRLEQLAGKSQESSWYDFDISKKDNVWIISHRKLIKAMLLDIKNRTRKEDIAKKFHNSLVILALKVIDRISQEYNLKDVVLSGGVFANRILFNSLKQKLSDAGYNLIIDKDIPVNDLSICLGQAYIASLSK